MAYKKKYIDDKVKYIVVDIDYEMGVYIEFKDDEK